MKTCDKCKTRFNSKFKYCPNCSSLNIPWHEKGWIRLLGIFVLLFIIFKTCNSPRHNETNRSYTSAEQMLNEDPHQVLSNVFKGNPAKEEIIPVIERILEIYNLPNTPDQIGKIGNMALVMRKKSIMGFTEMQLLRCMARLGDTKIANVSEQAAICSMSLDGEI